MPKLQNVAMREMDGRRTYAEIEAEEVKRFLNLAYRPVETTHLQRFLAHRLLLEVECYSAVISPWIYDCPAGMLEQVVLQYSIRHKNNKTPVGFSPASQYFVKED